MNTMYLVIEIQKSMEGTIANITTAYADRNQAESHYHSILSSAAISSLPLHSAVLLSEEGYLIASQYYIHEQPELEPNAE